VIGHEGPGAELLKVGDISFVTAGSDIRFALLSGRFVGEATLLRFYVLHCIAIPFAAVILIAVHFWRVRKDGGISGPM
jgi:quinol-cytochrome oxidoreductase complex cytochrome b subunit